MDGQKGSCPVWIADAVRPRIADSDAQLVAVKRPWK